MKYVKPLSLYQDLQKLHPSKRGRLLGLTVGADCFWAYRVGVAVSDANNEVASPYCVMERKKAIGYNQMMASSFQDMIKGTSSLIRSAEFPGDPLGKFEVKKFVDYLSNNLELVPYTYWEEEYLLMKRYEFMMCGSKRDPGLSEQILDRKYAASGTLQ
nr:polynucleotidyl transferase, ribonuclease H-like superfamily protein [Tanacetum cinerariifolium]